MIADLLDPNLMRSTVAQTNLFDGLWFRHNASEYSRDVNAVYYFIFFISAFFFVLLMALMAWYMVKYRRRQGVAAEPSPSHNTALELTWSIIPAIGFAIMFFWGTWVYLPKTIAPEGAEEITVTAKKWNWTFEYPNGAQSRQFEWVSDVKQPVFAVPAGKPVRFLLSSTDVIHSFYLPEFRVKRDCFPNRYTTAWVEPMEATHYFDRESETAKPLNENNNGYFLYCAEYCGDNHSQMTNRIVVLPDSDYRAWLESQANTDDIPLIELGQTLAVSWGCISCHSIDGSPGTGPSWKGIWGEPRPGYQAENSDENPRGLVDMQYTRESVLEPQAYVKPGWQANMPSYQGQLDDRDLRALGVYIQSLTDAFADEAQQQSDEEMAAEAETEAEAEAEREGGAGSTGEGAGGEASGV
jgi:cytochrome c oxidase subunit II